MQARGGHKISHEGGGRLRASAGGQYGWLFDEDGLAWRRVVRVAPEGRATGGLDYMSLVELMELGAVQEAVDAVISEEGA